MGSGCRATAGPANDARCVCDVEALWGGRVQVKAQPGSGPLGPVTKVETHGTPTPTSSSTTTTPHLSCTSSLPLCVRPRATAKTKCVADILRWLKKNGSQSLKCYLNKSAGVILNKRETLECNFYVSTLPRTLRIRNKCSGDLVKMSLFSVCVW